MAMRRLLATKPTDVRPSWRPYWKSSPWSGPSAIGRSRTFHRPNEMKTGSPTRNVERRSGDAHRKLIPVRRFAMTTATDVASSWTSRWIRTNETSANEKANVRPSM